MDLSQFETWTRGMLEAEARRCGIKGCEYRTRGELARLILRDRYGERWSAGRERIARRVRTLSEARALLGAAIDRTIASVLGLPEPVDEVRRWQGSALGGERVKRTPAVGARPEPGLVARRAPVADAGPGAAPRARVAEEALERDLISWVGASAEDAVVHWSTSEAGLARTRGVLGADGELAIRVVVVTSDPAVFVRTSVTDHAPVDRAGDLRVPAAVGGGHRIAAVGLRSGERFVSIAHARA